MTGKAPLIVNMHAAPEVAADVPAAAVARSAGTAFGGARGGASTLPA